VRGGYIKSEPRGGGEASRYCLRGRGVRKGTRQESRGGGGGSRREGRKKSGRVVKGIPLEMEGGGQGSRRFWKKVAVGHELRGLSTPKRTGSRRGRPGENIAGKKAGAGSVQTAKETKGRSQYRIQRRRRGAGLREGSRGCYARWTGKRSTSE